VSQVLVLASLLVLVLALVLVLVYTIGLVLVLVLASLLVLVLVLVLVYTIGLVLVLVLACPVLVNVTGLTPACPGNTLLHHVCYIKFGCLRSNRLGVRRGPKNFVMLRPAPLELGVG